MSAEVQFILIAKTFAAIWLIYGSCLFWKNSNRSDVPENLFLSTVVSFFIVALVFFIISVILFLLTPIAALTQG